MRKLLFLFLCLLFVSEIAEAQIRRNQIRRTYMQRMQRIGEWSFHGSAGISSYFGDLKQASPLWAKPTLGGGVQYRAGRFVSLRGELLWYRIAGADTLNDITHPIHPRNLSFRSDNVELNVSVVAYLFNKYERYNRPTWNPYAFAGIGATTNNPRTQFEGEWHNLRRLQTEGDKYGAVLLALPFGIGLTYHQILPEWDLSLEFGYRYTFNDYLDDVSTTYKDPATLSSPLAQALSDRRDEFIQKRGISKELATSNDYPGPYQFYWGDNYRGNPSNNDWYMISSVKVTYVPGAPVRRKYRRAKW
jgi:hypothetical protein